MADIERFQHWLDTVWIPEFRANKDLRHDSIEKFESFAAHVTAEKDKEIERLRELLKKIRYATIKDSLIAAEKVETITILLDGYEGERADG